MYLSFERRSRKNRQTDSDVVSDFSALFARRKSVSTLRERLEKSLEEREDLDGLTQANIARVLARDLGALPDTIGRYLRRMGYKPSPGKTEKPEKTKTKGKPEANKETGKKPRGNHFTHNQEKNTYTFHLGSLSEPLDISDMEIEHWVRWYTEAGAGLSLSEICRKTYQEHKWSPTEGALKSILKLLGISKGSPPLAPHVIEDSTTEEAVETWREIAQSEVETKFRATEAKYWKNLYEKTKHKLLRVDNLVNSVLENFETLPEVHIGAPHYRRPNKSLDPCVPILMLSDWHVGMKDIDFSFDVLEKRIEVLFGELEEWLHIYRRPFEEFHVAVAGDIIDGAVELRSGQNLEQDIHGAEQNAKASRLLAKVICWPEASVGSPVFVHTVTGNHGRATKSRREDPERLCESICYVLAEEMTRTAVWHRHTNPVGMWKVFDTTCLVTHGDRTPRDLKKLAWSYSASGPTIILSGHKHHMSVLQERDIFLVAGGSLCGTTGYARDQLGVAAPPSQVLVEVRKSGPRPGWYIPV